MLENSKLQNTHMSPTWEATLQENIRWKALDEIYKIYMLLHRSDLCTKFAKFSEIWQKR